MLTSDLPSGAWTTLGGNCICVTCSSSSTTQVTFDDLDGQSLSDAIDATIVAFDDGDIVKGRVVKIDDIAHTIHAHPTLAEAMLDASNSVYGMAINA